MKISFDFGTKEHIDLGTIDAVMRKVIEDANSQHVTVGKCSIYINFFDEDGIMTDLYRPSDNAEINYVVRKHPYKRIPKNVEYRARVITKPDENGEVSEVATVYTKYVK